MADGDAKDARLQLRTAILDILHKRSPGKTCCPSEAARRVSPKNWQQLMEATREAARQLRKEGLLDICQKGQVVGETWSGPIRLRLRSKATTPSPQSQLTLDSLFKPEGGHAPVNEVPDNGSGISMKEDETGERDLCKVEVKEEVSSLSAGTKRKAQTNASSLKDLETVKKKNANLKRT